MSTADLRHHEPMRTVVRGPRPPELEALLQRRRELGQDGFDEVWDGVLHMAPHAHSDHGILAAAVAHVLWPHAKRAGLIPGDSFNVGEPGDFRVPDGGYHRVRPGTVYVPTAAVVVEVVSPDDESLDKLPFYAARGVGEALLVWPELREVHCWDLTGERPRRVPASRELGVSMSEVAAAVEWPS